jgi:hypothetical protein
LINNLWVPETRSGVRRTSSTLTSAPLGGGVGASKLT